MASKLYNAELPAMSRIKMDLEYVAKNWAFDCFDLWEEVKGRHFYTLVSKYASLVDGADLATRMDDDGASNW
jgi:glucoamylase